MGNKFLPKHIRRLDVSQTADGLAFPSPAGDRFELTADFSTEWDAML